MLEEIKKISFFMATFIFIIFALLPFFYMVDSNIEDIDSYYYEHSN